ncbi:hypothetical protein LguiA_021358 [Lonicera macranthoides]
MRSLVGTDPPPAFKVLKASMAEFPALNGQSVSYAVLEFPASRCHQPTPHLYSCVRASLSCPRLVYLVESLPLTNTQNLNGTLEVGFVDTTNKLYTQTLQIGDLFVFPKGLVHFQYNVDTQNPALAVSAFGSATAGTVSVPTSVFTTGIDDNILAQSFKTDVATIQKIKAGLAPKP